jgi:hypothetical protein
MFGSFNIILAKPADPPRTVFSWVLMIHISEHFDGK